MILLVVESPNKIKKIEHILGNGYKVVASVGHIMDLDPSKMSIELDNGFNPIYIINADKKTVVANLKKSKTYADEILLATDEDREGEMIAWSVANVLKLDVKKAKRITFNAITKGEIMNAIKNPRTINMDLVDAQKARRILDRIVGYELSPLLIKHLGGKGTLSAGRVQSVVARLIVDRESEIKKFLSGNMKSYFKFVSVFTSLKKYFKAQLYDLEGKLKTGEYKGEQSKVITEADARNIMTLYTNVNTKFKVEHVFDKKKTKGASPPFTTSTLQQDGNRKYGFSVKKTMMTAQKLYEAGYITYMRTDSVNLSDEAINAIKKYIIDTYGEKYYKMTQYKSKSKNTQEAHEAIRPTDLFTTTIEDDGKMGADEVKLYSLIWKRSVASQMKPAEYNVTSIQISINKDNKHFFMTTIENLVFAGFLLVYNVQENDDDESEKEDTNQNVPIPKVGDILPLEELTGAQEYYKPPGRYNEASLVDKLDPKNLNIGRPATYSSIIDKIKTRKYVEIKDMPGKEVDSLTLIWPAKQPPGSKQSVESIQEKKEKIIICKEKNKFVPTHLGILVNSFLMVHFPKIMDYQFTSTMEDKLDDVANGSLKWADVLKEFYDEFHPLIISMLKEMPEIQTKDMRLLGTDPELGYQIYATIGLYGPVVKMLCDGKSKYAPIKEPLTLETITLNHAITLFEYPRDLGIYEKKKIVLNRGQYGLYLTHGNNKYSLNKGPVDAVKEKQEKDEEEEDDEEKEEKVDDDETITLEAAIKIIKSKQSLKEFDTEVKRYQICSGPYGNYIKTTDKKTKKVYTTAIPKTESLDKLTVERVVEIISQKYQKGSKFTKTASIKTSTKTVPVKTSTKTVPIKTSTKTVPVKTSTKTIAKIKTDTEEVKKKVIKKVAKKNVIVN